MTAKEIRRLSKHELIKGLLDNIIPFDEVMSAFNIYPILYKLKPEILGFVYRSKKGNYHIVVSCRLDKQKQREVFLHEIKHIIFDFPRKPYIVGLDMQRTKIEMKADRVAEALMQYGA